jgi:lysozyme
MLNSLWAKQTPARAKRLAEQMRTGEWVWKA